MTIFKDSHHFSRTLGSLWWQSCRTAITLAELWAVFNDNLAGQPSLQQNFGQSLMTVFNDSAFFERTLRGCFRENYGDRFRPQFLGLFPTFPLQMAFHSMAVINGGDPNDPYDSTGMILQAAGHPNSPAPWDPSSSRWWRSGGIADRRQGHRDTRSEPDQRDCL